MKATIQVWIFMSALLLVVGYIMSSAILSILAMVAAIIAHSKYKRTTDYSENGFKNIIKRLQNKTS